MTHSINADVLIQNGVEQIHTTGRTGSEVAAEILQREWRAMPVQLQRHFAVIGLGKLINDQMASERRQEEERLMREWDEEMKPHREREAARQREWEAQQQARREQEEEQARQDALALKDAPPLEEVVDWLHAQFLCPFVTHEREFKKRLDCVQFHCGVVNEAGHRDPRLLSPEEQEQAVKRAREPGEQDRAARLMCLEIASNMGYQEALNNMRSIMLIASDGTMKSLLDFTLKDVRQWRKKSTANALSWRERRRFFRRAEKLLTEAGAECVADLSREHIEELAELAKSIWKKASRKCRKAAEVAEVAES